MTVTITSDLARRFAAQADIDLDSLPDGTCVGWKSVHPDLRSGHNRDFRWPASGECAEPAAADAVPTGDGCGPGLHVALTALGARQSGVRLGTVLVVAWTAADEIQRTDDKVRLRRCDVLGVAGATRAYLAGAKLTDAYLAGANLNGADLTRAYLYGADLTDANLDGADLNGANLRGANLNGADLTDAKLRGAKLRGAYLAGGRLDGVRLRGANLVGANLTRADLTDADLTRANLRGANLRGANLVGANLYGANLTGAKLYGADLYGAKLYGAKLAGAACDRWTRWPEGFDAEAAGVTVQ